MVQTRSAAKRVGSAQVHTNDKVLSKDTSLELFNGIPPHAKRPRRQNVVAPKERRCEVPREPCRLNLDVLFLIAAYTHPADLLSLSRTCKSLRELLMEQSSSFVWRIALQQAEGFPGCPEDLSESEYATLAFDARCHDCGKYVSTIFWNMRRRYCLVCRRRRFCQLSSCHEVIRTNAVLPVEETTLNRDHTKWVDKDQVTSFVRDYVQAPDKERFISDKQNQYSAIRRHANSCEAWHAQNQKECREKRVERIFQHLNQHGYESEITYFGRSRIQSLWHCRSDFRSSQLLTDEEWDRMWPEWAKIMNHLRSTRLEAVVYRPRRTSLAFAYQRYCERWSPDAPKPDLLPHVSDLAHFPCIRDILEAPVGTHISHNESFASAFAQLPELAAEWREKLEAQLAALVKIPLRFSSGNASRRVLASSNMIRTGSSRTDSDTLHLACALFQTDAPGAFTHLEALTTSMLNHTHLKGRDANSEFPGSISDRFGIQFLEEAPYIVHACGLDSNVAKAEDMDRRNARLKCLCCGSSPSIVMDWRNAMWHAGSHHQLSRGLAPLSESPRWQLVADKHVNAIQNIEQSIEGEKFSSPPRCLYCVRRVGNVLLGSIEEVQFHLYLVHRMTRKTCDIKQGVYYMPTGICDPHLVVEMVERGGQVTFRVPTE